MTPPEKLMADFTDEERAVIRERRLGWEKASATDLALIFRTSPRVIAAICRKSGG